MKHIKTDKIDKFILIGCEADDLCENDKLLNFWSNKFLNKEAETEMRNFKKKTGWSFMTLVKRGNFYKIQGICM